MKKLYFILLLILPTLAVKAQNLSFDETVKYINDKISNSRNSNTFVVKRNGSVSYGDKTCNLFDLSQTPCTYDKVVKQDKGIIFVAQPEYIRVNLATEYSALALKGPVIFFDSEKDAERVYNAFIYLRSLCTKSSDPFDK